jgi:multiple sugar transport system permease protein
MKERRSLLHNPRVSGYLMAAPGVIWLVIWIVIPFASALVLSLTNRTLIPNAKIGTSFVGLRNYVELFGDREFLRALLNNLQFTATVVPAQCVFGLLLALLLNRKVKGIGVFRVLYFLPIVLPMLVVAMTWALLFTPNANGFINSMLSAISFGKIVPLKWLYDANTAMLSISIFSIWAGVGLQTIIILAGLQSVDIQLYEAARIDGATTFQQFWNVTIPQIENTLIFVFLASTIQSFKLFTQVLVLTRGGPLGSTNTAVYMIYDTGFIDQRLGYSSGISVIFFLFVLSISIVQQRILKMTQK